MKSFSTIAELTSYVDILSKKAINIITEKIKAELIENIDKNIYSSYQPIAYRRTYEFRDKAWVAEKAKQTAEYIIGQVRYAPENMRYNATLWQHGSESVDRRADLARILNGGSEDGDWDFGRPNLPSSGDFRDTGHFFNETIEWLNNNFTQLVIDAYSKVGLPINLINNI